MTNYYCRERCRTGAPHLVAVLVTAMLFLIVPVTAFAPVPSMPSGSAAMTSTELFYSYMPKARSSGPRPNRPPQKLFIIERISDCQSEGVYREIADVCIDVFFKESLNAGPEDRVP
jgi:hypothetical protein